MGQSTFKDNKKTPALEDVIPRLFFENIFPCMAITFSNNKINS